MNECWKVLGVGASWKRVEKLTINEIKGKCINEYNFFIVIICFYYMKYNKTITGSIR